MTVSELVKENRARESEYMPELERLRREFPTLYDHDRLIRMYLKMKDKYEDARIGNL